YNLQLQCILAVYKTAGIGITNDPRIIYELMYYTSDLFSLGPAIYLLLLPGPVRQFLARIVMDAFQKISSRNVVQTAYGIPGILSYFLAFFAMYGVRRLLSGSFIVIYTIMSLSNLITWFNAWMFLKLRHESLFMFYYEWLSKIPLLVNAHSFLISHLYFVQNIDLLLLTFDRFAVIISMMKN
ncbi:hypothetical protein PMAYCL1PPCAC_05195, partial [Pristionchus mayeri]